MSMKVSGFPHKYFAFFYVVKSIGVKIMLIIILFIYGSCTGSLLVAMASRYVTGDSYLFPASHCDTCQTPLVYWQLVPVLSYALLRGKCQNCGETVPAVTLIVEVAAGLLATTVIDWPSLLVVLWLGLWGFAALCDWQTQTFPGWVSWITTGLSLWHHSPLIWLLGCTCLLAIHLLWPRWRHPVIGDGDLEMMVSHGFLWGVAATAHWLVVACLLGLWRARGGGRIAFLPDLVVSAVGWWLVV